ncbi:unnamed protein product, partial [Ixodes persulcatus]
GHGGTRRGHKNQPATLHGATRVPVRGHSACVHYLLRHNATVDLPDIKAQTPLLIAIQNKYTDCASALIKAGANPNGDPGNRSTPLYIAAQIGYVEGVKLLLAAGADTEVEHRLLGCAPGLPLHISAIYHHFQCYSTLLLNGAEPDLRHICPSVPTGVYAKVLKASTNCCRIIKGTLTPPKCFLLFC